MIGIVDYGAGNLRSVENALDRLGAPSRVVSTPEDLSGTRALIFPGVGAARPSMASLRARGLDRAILAAIGRGTPYLGICLGLQLLFERSAEDATDCLGLLNGDVVRLKTREKLPHVGWNTVNTTGAHPVLQGLDRQAFYFVHAYVAVPRDPVLVAAQTVHGVPFVSAVARDRVIGVQFHPERSGEAGLTLLRSFVRWSEELAA
jgi:imidazole glycerol-phosphate synthase subunit HisH